MEKIEHQHIDLFSSSNDNIAKHLRLALDMKRSMNPPNFCGYADFDDRKVPFDLSSVVSFQKCLILEILTEIDEIATPIPNLR